MLIWGQALLWMIVANAVVYAGIFFMNSQFIPSYLTSIYENTTYTLRLIICLFTFLTLGNILFSKGFQIFDINQAALMNIIAFVLVQIFIAVIFSNTMPNLMLIPAVMVLCASVYWVYTLLPN